MRHLLLGILALTALIALAAALSCQDSVTLPPIKGPPLRVPPAEARSTPSQPLQIIHVSPAGQLDSPHVQITVSFNRPMVDLATVEQRAALSPLSIQPVVVGKQRWLGTRTLTFVPDGPLPGSTTFTLRIPEGLRAVDGTTLARGKTWSFSTPRLQVSRITPSKGQRWIKPDATISLRFNQPVTPQTLQRHLTLSVVSAGGGKPIVMTARVKQGENPKHMVLHPAMVVANRARVRPLPTDARITVSIDEAMTSLEGPLPMGQTYSSFFSTYGTFRALGLSCSERCDPEDSILLRFSNPVPYNRARRAIRINGKPLRAGSSSYPTASIYLDHRFAARQRYVITVDPALTDRFGQRLVVVDRPFVLSTGDYAPYVSLPIRSGVLEARGPKMLPIYFRNASEAKLLSKRLSPSELADLLGREDYWDEKKLMLSDLKDVRRQQLKGVTSPNRRITRQLDLGSLIGPTGRGVLALELASTLQGRDKRKERRVRRVVVRITDLAVTAKVAPHASLVWITSLSSGIPVPGCDVSIWNPKKKGPIWSGISDGSGLALAAGANELGLQSESEALIFFVRKGRDESFVLSSTQSGISPWDFGLDASWEDRRASLLGMLFSDRGIYRPGETVHIKGIMRQTDDHGLVTPQNAKVKLQIVDSRGEQLHQSSQHLSRFGSLYLKLDLPPSSPLGAYQIVATLADGGSVQGGFRVEEYRPASFKVELEAERPQIVRKDSMAWTGRAAYLFGAPMQGAQARWYLHWRAEHFQPPRHEGYVFSDEIRWWERESRDTSGFVSQGRGSLDHGGSISKRTALRPTGMRFPRRYEIEATVTDISRQSISGRTSVLLHPAGFYIGAKPDKTFITGGESLQTEVVAVTPEGKRLSGKTIHGTLYRRTWHAVRKKGFGGAHTFVTRPVDTNVGGCRLVTASTPKACSVVADKAGYYFLRLTSTDARDNPIFTSFGVYASGAEYVPWRRDDDNLLQLVPDRKRYRVGQVARILIKSPFPKAQALLTVERSGILERRAFTLDRTATFVKVPITKELVPNAYVSVMLARGRTTAPKGTKITIEDPGKPAFRIGYARLAVSHTDRRLKLRVTPGQTSYRPGDQVLVDLAVRDARGKPVQAELTVFAADEGVLRLIGYQTPDPISLFYADRGLSVRTADSRLRLISRRDLGIKGSNPGGGGTESGAPGPGIRRQFVSTPYFNPAVITDGSGRARVSFKLPDNLTSYRIMAVAASSGAEFGRAHSTIKVNKPLLLLPALPRLVRVGDRVQAGVVVHNHTASAGRVRVRAEAKGVQLVGRPVQTLSVGRDGSIEARFPLQAHHPGTARLRFSATVGDASDALEIELPVKLAVVTETVATSGSTLASVAEGIVPSQGIRTDVGGLKLALSSSALVDLKAGVDYLMDYPYECLEQTTSRLIPLVLLRDLTRTFDPSRSTTQMDELAGRLVARIQQLQRWSGGFGFWSSTHEADPWSSAYATWGLVQAKAAGIRVSGRILKSATEYLKQQLRNRSSASDPRDLNTRVYLTHVLVELGENPAGYLSTLYEKREHLAVFGKALLLSALAHVNGDSEMMASLLQQILNQVHQTGTVAKVEENLGDGYSPLFHSDVRSTAMVLIALLGSRPSHPLAEKLVRYLLDVRREGRWRNTQETVYALLGLQRYYKMREQEVPDFVAHIVLGRSKLLEQRFSGRSLKVHQHSIPMKRLSGFSGPLGFVKKGSGRLYYNASLRYARSALPEDPWDEGFFVTRTYERVRHASLDMTAPPSPSVDRVKAGDLVRVTLRVVAPQQMHYVALDDPLPAGLEAVNFQLTTSARTRARGIPPSPFHHQEIRDDRVLLFADTLPPGLHTHVYLARATSIGTFVAPPARVEQMYAPEVFGRTGTSRLTVEGRSHP